MSPLPISRDTPDPEAARRQYRRRAGVYDAELIPFEPLRREAIDCLALQPGETVLDVGCGTGLSLESLQRGVGPQGRIVAIDLCPEMLAHAQDRVTEQAWHNVTLRCAPAGEAPLQGVVADAALFHFTHDILRDPHALAHLFAHLRPGARVAATGLQWAPPWMWPTNGFVLLAALHSVTSMEGLGRPWDRLAEWLDELEVRTSAFGGIYVLHGRVRSGGRRRGAARMHA